MSTKGKKTAVLWYVTPYGLVGKYQHFHRTQCLCIKGEMIRAFAASDKQHGRSQWPRGPRRRSAAASLLRLWVRISPGAWMFVCCECCVLSGRSLCDELITRPEESYRLWCVVVCDLETSSMRRPWPAFGPQRHSGGGISSMGEKNWGKSSVHDRTVRRHNPKYRIFRQITRT